MEEKYFKILVRKLLTKGTSYQRGSLFHAGIGSLFEAANDRYSGPAAKLDPQLGG
jgi:hypothetical protein